MPDSGVVDEEMFEAVCIAPPEGPARRSEHTYVLCARMAENTQDHDW